MRRRKEAELIFAKRNDHSALVYNLLGHFGGRNRFRGCGHRAVYWAGMMFSAIQISLSSLPA